jgi:hypothetical protein
MVNLSEASRMGVVHALLAVVVRGTPMVLAEALSAHPAVIPMAVIVLVYVNAAELAEASRPALEHPHNTLLEKVHKSPLPKLPAPLLGRSGLVYLKVVLLHYLAYPAAYDLVTLQL